MAKRVVVAVVAVFICWVVVDFVVHGIVLPPSYRATAALWRPMGEMKMGLSYLVSFLSCLSFVLIYALLSGKRGLGTGLAYGALFGFGTGVSMGYGSYAAMPIPYTMALAWFLGTLVKGVIGGALAGVVVRDRS